MCKIPDLVISIELVQLYVCNMNVYLIVRPMTRYKLCYGAWAVRKSMKIASATYQNHTAGL